MSDNKCKTMTVVSILWRKVLLLFTCVASLFIFNEFLMYYVVLLQCSWPQLDVHKADSNIIDSGSEPLKLMFIADTHLLGSREGHWFDKLRREWMMERSFQAAVSIYNPEVIFVLGDLLDEGKWSNDAEFYDTVARFQKIFAVNSENKLEVVVGNHDIGFHYMINDHNRRRFSSAFDAPSVRQLDIRGNTFILINSMAFEGDGCSMCRDAELKLQEIVHILNCRKGKLENLQCKNVSQSSYSMPILLQHFPLYRPSDINCTGPDSADLIEKQKKFKQRWDCLSEEISKKLLTSLNPRLVVSAHTHNFCLHVHPDGTQEWSVASFSWRNQKNPSFLLAVVNNNNFAIKKCYQPREITVVYLYIFGGLSFVGWFVYSHRKSLHVYRTIKLN